MLLLSIGLSKPCIYGPEKDQQSDHPNPSKDTEEEYLEEILEIIRIFIFVIKLPHNKIFLQL